MTNATVATSTTSGTISSFAVNRVVLIGAEVGGPSYDLSVPAKLTVGTNGLDGFVAHWRNSY